MYSYAAHDVNEALQYGLEYLLREGIEEDSRGGKVLSAPSPVCIEYAQPRRRVLYSPTRDANHFFHVMETLWMLSGSNKIEFPCFFNNSYSQFSDDGTTMWDSYGWRWRSFFGWDQLDAIVTELQHNPNSRRCVLAMWGAGDPAHMADGEWESCIRTPDFYVATHGGKAVPCNTHAYFAIRNGKLNMTVCNRSNDSIWGAFGANAVHFSFLLEYMAARIGVEIGSYYQFTNNLHIYTERFSTHKLADIIYECETLSHVPDVCPTLLDAGVDEDLPKFIAWGERVTRENTVANCLDVPNLKTAFMQNIAVPMLLCWAYRKQGDLHSMEICLDGIDAPDWRRACGEWIERRKK